MAEVDRFLGLIVQDLAVDVPSPSTTFQGYTHYSLPTRSLWYPLDTEEIRCVGFGAVS